MAGDLAALVGRVVYWIGLACCAFSIGIAIFNPHHVKLDDSGLFQTLDICELVAIALGGGIYFTSHPRGGWKSEQTDDAWHR